MVGRIAAAVRRTSASSRRPRAARETYHLQAPPAEDPLRGRDHVAPVPLQVPHDVPPRDLREHLLDAFDICLARAEAARRTSAVRPRACARREEEVADSEPTQDYDEDQLWDADGLIGGHGERRSRRSAFPAVI